MPDQWSSLKMIKNLHMIKFLNDGLLKEKSYNPNAKSKNLLRNLIWASGKNQKLNKIKVSRNWIKWWHQLHLSVEEAKKKMSKNKSLNRLSQLWITKQLWKKLKKNFINWAPSSTSSSVNSVWRQEAMKIISILMKKCYLSWERSVSKLKTLEKLKRWWFRNY